MNCADNFIGGTTESQREFLDALSTEDTRRNQDRQSSKQPPIANNFALGYTYHDVLDADHEGKPRSKHFTQVVKLKPSRHTRSPFHIPPLRPLALLHTTSTAPPEPKKYRGHAHSHTARLVTTMVLAEAIARLGTATAETFDIVRR